MPSIYHAWEAGLGTYMSADEFIDKYDEDSRRDADWVRPRSLATRPDDWAGRAAPSYRPRLPSVIVQTGSPPPLLDDHDDGVGAAVSPSIWQRIRQRLAELGFYGQRVLQQSRARADSNAGFFLLDSGFTSVESLQVPTWSDEASTESRQPLLGTLTPSTGEDTVGEFIITPDGTVDTLNSAANAPECSSDHADSPHDVSGYPADSDSSHSPEVPRIPHDFISGPFTAESATTGCRAGDEMPSIETVESTADESDEEMYCYCSGNHPRSSHYDPYLRPNRGWRGESDECLRRELWRYVRNAFEAGAFEDGRREEQLESRASGGPPNAGYSSNVSEVRVSAAMRSHAAAVMERLSQQGEDERFESWLD